MSNLERSMDRLLANPPEADFSDVRRVLEAYGWAQVRQRGSHVAFTKTGEASIIVPLARGKVKRVYVARICTRLGISK